MFAPVRRWTLLLVALLVVSAAPLAAQDDDVIVPPARAVRDNLDIFSPEARAKANLSIAEIKSRYKTTLIIESLKPPALGDLKDAKKIDAAYMSWLGKHAKEMMGKEGILVAIFPAEKKAFCLVGPGTQKLFSVDKAADLPKKIAPTLAGKEFDKALAAAVAHVRAGLPVLKDPDVKTDSDTWFHRTGGAVEVVPEEDDDEVIAPPPLAVRDEAGIFSPEARAKANKIITDIKTRYATSLVVETLKARKLPDGVDPTDAKAVDAFYEKELKEHAKKRLGTSGILVALVPEVRKVYCFVGPETQKKKLFSVAKATELPKKVEATLTAKKYDEALETAVTYVRTALPPRPDAPVRTDSDSWFGDRDESKAAPGTSGDQRTPWLSYLLVFVGVLLVLWLIMAIFRGFANARAANAAGAAGGVPGAAPAPAGGGFMRGFLGGLVGAAAGMWLYNSFFGHHGSSAWGSSSPTDMSGGHHDAGGADHAAGGDAGGDWGGGGGDWGGGDAGGDWGGGGADFGGGDWGGGGGDW